MHSAASVAYPVARSRRGGAMLALLWVLGAIPVGWWLWAVPAPWGLRAALVAWTCAIGLWTGWLWWRTTPCVLLWDGQAWRVEAPDGVVVLAEAHLTVALDLQRLMLLRLHPLVGRTRWIGVDRIAAPERWHGLRCAVTAAAFVSNDAAQEAVAP